MVDNLSAIWCQVKYVPNPACQPSSLVQCRPDGAMRYWNQFLLFGTCLLIVVLSVVVSGIKPTVLISMAVSWDVAPCSLVGFLRKFFDSPHLILNVSLIFISLILSSTQPCWRPFSFGSGVMYIIISFFFFVIGPPSVLLCPVYSCI